MELIDFENLRTVLEEFAVEFRDAYRAELERSDRFTQHGKDRLIDSVSANTVQTMVQAGDTAWTVSINLKEYWKYVEYDTKPHWPPPSAILNWVQIKPVLPRPDSRGRIPSQKSLAYLIGRKISQVGTKGSHDFEHTREALLERFKVRVREALAADVHNYIHVLMHS